MRLKRGSANDVVHVLLLEEKVLRSIGLWPTNADTLASISLWLLAIVIQISTICSLSLEIYWHCYDAGDTMDAFVMNLSSVVSLAKMLIIRFNSKSTYILVKSIADDWSTINDSRHRRIMTEYSRIGGFVSLTILYLGYTAGSSFIFKAIPFDALPSFRGSHSISSNSTGQYLKEELKLSYFLGTKCIFGSLSWIPHGCILIHQMVHIFINGTAHCANDGFFFYLVMHLCGQFEILKLSLAEMDINKLGRKKLNALINRHCRLVILADNLEETFNMVILVQLLMSALLLCMAGFQFLLSLGANDKVDALKHVTLIVTMLVQLYVYAYAGASLESHTEEIAFAAYDSPWYDLRACSMRDLNMVIHRGSIAYPVTAGKFLSMNLFTFKEILKTSASYMSVLRVMMDK